MVWVFIGEMDSQRIERERAILEEDRQRVGREGARGA